MAVTVDKSVLAGIFIEQLSTTTQGIIESNEKEGNRRGVEAGNLLRILIDNARVVCYNRLSVALKDLKEEEVLCKIAALMKEVASRNKATLKTVAASINGLTCPAALQ